MNIGDVVRIDKCEMCPGVVGKVVPVKGFREDTETMVKLGFGRGRPAAGRPEFFSVDDLTVINVHVLGDTDNPASSEDVEQAVESLQDKE